LCQQLHTAVSNNDFATLRTLLTDANNNNLLSVLNLKHQGQETALVQACYANSEDCVKLLIEAGADLNTKDSVRNSVLYTTLAMFVISHTCKKMWL